MAKSVSFCVNFGTSFSLLLPQALPQVALPPLAFSWRVAALAVAAPALSSPTTRATRVSFRLMPPVGLVPQGRQGRQGHPGPSSSSGPGLGNLAPTANEAGGGQGPRDPKLCGVLTCLANKAGKSSYCGGHRRVVEGMEAQVSTHGEEAIWEKCSKDPAALTEEVNRRVEHNPCLMKPYARHPPMEWSQVQRRLSNRTFMRDESVLKKLDKIEYRHRMKNKRGWEFSRSDAEFARLERTRTSAGTSLVKAVRSACSCRRATTLSLAPSSTTRHRTSPSPRR